MKIDFKNGSVVLHLDARSLDMALSVEMQRICAHLLALGVAGSIVLDSPLTSATVEQHREVPAAIQPHITESAPALPEVPLMPPPESLPDMDIARLAEFLNNQPAQIFNDDGVLQQTVQPNGPVRSSLSDVPKTGSLFQSVAQTSSLLADEKTFGGRPEDLADRKIA